MRKEMKPSWPHWTKSECGTVFTRRFSLYRIKVTDHFSVYVKNQQKPVKCFLLLEQAKSFINKNERLANSNNS